MALKGKAKKEYQKRYMRDYMEKKRLVVKRMLAERYGVPMPKVDVDGEIIPDGQ